MFHHLTRCVSPRDVHRSRSILHLSALRRHPGPQQVVSVDGAHGPAHGNVHHDLPETRTGVEMVGYVSEQQAHRKKPFCSVLNRTCACNHSICGLKVVTVLCSYTGWPKK